MIAPAGKLGARDKEPNKPPGLMYGAVYGPLSALRRAGQLAAARRAPHTDSGPNCGRAKQVADKLQLVAACCFFLPSSAGLGQLGSVL